MTADGVLDIPWGCTLEELITELKNKGYDTSELSENLSITRMIDGCEVDYSFQFTPYYYMTDEDASILCAATISPKNRDDMETVRNAITAELGEKLVGGVTMNGGYYGEMSRWTSGKTVLEMMYSDEVIKAVEDGAPEMSLYSYYPLTVTEGKDYFTADANWGIMLRHWIEG